MRRLQRILSERKTRRLVDQMIHKYSDIRLAATTRAMARKRPRTKATCVRKPPVNGDDNDQSDMAAELSTSSTCRTESERSPRLSSTMLDVERSQSAKGLEGHQRQEEARLDRWRMSDAPTVSECGSGASSTRLTRLLEEEDECANQQTTTDSRRQETEDGHECSDSSECDHSTANLESSVGDQIEEQSQLSESSTESPPTSSTTETLPRLRPTATAPTQCVVPNCCDYFTSPHPHYPKEVIGLAQKVEEPLNDPSQLNSTSSESTTAVDGSREGLSETRSGGQSNNNSSGDGRDSDFEMWDYVCPQYARRGYANEWI